VIVRRRSRRSPGRSSTGSLHVSALTISIARHRDDVGARVAPARSIRARMDSRGEATGRDARREEQAEPLPPPRATGGPPRVETDSAACRRADGRRARIVSSRHPDSLTSGIAQIEQDVERIAASRHGAGASRLRSAALLRRPALTRWPHACWSGSGGSRVQRAAAGPVVAPSRCLRCVRTSRRCGRPRRGRGAPGWPRLRAGWGRRRPRRLARVSLISSAMTVTSSWRAAGGRGERYRLSRSGADRRRQRIRAAARAAGGGGPVPGASRCAWTPTSPSRSQQPWRRVATGDVLVFLNDDIERSSRLVPELVR